MRILIAALALAAACVSIQPTTLHPPARSGTAIAASRDAAWRALLGVWSENARSLGVITHTDPEGGLLVASLSRSSTPSVARDMPKWGTCPSRGSLTLDPDSMTWTVVVQGTEQSSSVRAEAVFWKLGRDCQSHGVREAELETLVRTVAEGAQGDMRDR